MPRTLNTVLTALILSAILPIRPTKPSGTAYIRFARNEPNLFHLLYMRDRRREDHSGDAENIAVLVDFLMAKLSLTREDATLLHIEMWAYVHGIAVLCASRAAELGRRAHQPDADRRLRGHQEQISEERAMSNDE